jgi:hypothetical protein
LRSFSCASPMRKNPNNRLTPQSVKLSSTRWTFTQTGHCLTLRQPKASTSIF